MTPADGNSERQLDGISASPGICIGKAYLVDKEGVDIVKQYYVQPNTVQDEVNRFKTAVKQATEELRAIIDETPDDLRQHAYILETHMVLLKDKMLYERTIEAIEKEKINAEWALKKIVANVKGMFLEIADAYLKERAADIVHVSDRIMRNLVGAEQVNIGAIDKRVILIADDLSPAETSQIQLERIMGFVTARGGRASHTSIIARTLGIPAVLGLGKATQQIRNDDLIIIDGTAGVVIINPDEETLLSFEEQKNRWEEYQARITRKGRLASETLDGVKINIMGNIELPEELVSVLDHGGDGIGLYRTEFQYLSRPDFPSEFELYDRYKDVVDVLAHRPVTIRTLDINGDKAIANGSMADEANPALGLRAIRYCLKKPDVFRTQLRAILRVAVHGNVRILFPMISSIEEVDAAIAYLDETAADLQREGIAHNRDIEIGIMVEVPSAVALADLLAEKVDFFSIGTNDLIQYTLAIDRGNREVAHLYNPLHPAILRMIKRICDVAAEKGIMVTMCGEMAGDPLHVPILVGMGMSELSMNPHAIPEVKSMVRAISTTDAEQIVADLLKLSTSEQIDKLLHDTYNQTLKEKVYNGHNGVAAHH